MRILTTILLLFSLCAYGQRGPNGHQELDFPNETLRKEIADKLFDGIEEIDALNYEVRNKTRSVKWATFRDKSTFNITKAQNWNDLYHALNNVHFGIINRHSFVLVQDAISSKVTEKHRWPKFQLGYTWPEVSFFDIDTKKSIQAIAGFPVHDLFDEFYNYYCNDAHQQGCLARFVRYMEVGYFFEEYREQITIEFTSNSEKVISKSTAEILTDSHLKDCSEVYPELKEKLKYESPQVCLFVLSNKNIVRIKRFGNWGAAYSDIYCVAPHSVGMCSDINQIKSLLGDEPQKELIIDLQGNSGGKEVTPWLAALTRNGFYDNRIQYKNIRYLQEPKILENAFYYSSKAENWYKNLALDLKEPPPFLSTRADFCRASDSCKVELIFSAKYPIHYTKLKLITDQDCVSSCDDFVWRLRENADAKVYGQPPATDGAYARLHGYIFLNDEGEVVRVTLGEDQAVPQDKGTLLVSYRMPISRTVDSDGRLLEGDDSVLDVPLSITHANYHQIRRANLQRVLSQ